MGKTNKTRRKAVDGNGKEEEKPSKKINRSGSGKVCTGFPFPFMDLPTEIIHRIFFMLPINSIIQCKRVCKSWRNLICQTPNFAFNYMRNTQFETLWLTSICLMQHRVVLLEISENGELFETPMKITQKHRKNPSDEMLRIIGSCNGLICILLKSYNKHREQIYLFKLISSDRISDVGCNHVFVDNWKKETIYQFGFIPSANKFKLLRLVFNTRDLREFSIGSINLPRNSGDFDGLAIFTVGEDDDWRPLPADSVSISPSDAFRLRAFVSFNGVVHWINNRHQIVSTFDLGHEKGDRISVPNPVKDFDMKDFEIKVLKDHLSLVKYRMSDEISIWMMKEYPIEESWTKEYVISIKPGHYTSLVSWYSSLDVVAVLPTGDILFSARYLNKYPICYNPQEKEWKFFHDVYGISMDGYKIAGVPIPDINPIFLGE